MESLGYDCKDDDEKPLIHLYRGGGELGTIQVQLIMQHALKENKPDNRRRQQLRAILQKYRNLSANKEELAAHMKKKFGISLVFVGKSDTPYGYIVVDHKNKTVFKGGEFLSIKELLQFEDAATRFAKIERTIDELLGRQSEAHYARHQPYPLSAVWHTHPQGYRVMERGDHPIERVRCPSTPCQLLGVERHRQGCKTCSSKSRTETTTVFLLASSFCE
jgi:hypothetical protein